MKRRKLNVSKLLTLGLLLSYSANIAANTTSETTSIQQNSSYKVTGVVSDTNGEPIIGASVVEKGTSNGTITDLDGKFTIEVNAGATLNISYIGYKNQEVKVDRNGLSLKLTLKEDTETLDEVVVVGYGTVRKADLAGSVAVMDNKSFQRPACYPNFRSSSRTSIWCTGRKQWRTWRRYSHSCTWCKLCKS